MISIAQNYLEDKRQRLLLEYSRVGLYLILLCVGIFSYIYQRSFTDWRVMQAVLGGLAFGFFLHGAQTSFIDFFSRHPKILLFTFVLDALLISGIVYQSGIHQSLVLFFFLVNILLCGLIFRNFGSFTLASFTSVAFTLLTLLSPEIKTPNQILILFLNNFSFFSVALLAGYVSQQMESIHLALQSTGANLKSLEALNEEIIANMPAGLVTFDDSGSIIQTNSVLTGILGEVVAPGDNIFNLLPGARNVISEMRSLEMPDGQTFDLSFKNKRGDPLILVLNPGRIDNSSLKKKINILLIEDLTKVRNLEYSLRQSEKMAAIGGLAAGIAHEIRNPLASISGSIELLSQNTTNEEDGKLMRIILREIDRLNRLIGEFLEYSRPEPPPSDPVDLVPLLTEVLDSLKLDRLNQGPKEVMQVRDFPTKALILGRHDKLKQALLNIVINSYQALLGVDRAPELRVRILLENSHWVLRIADNGCGMSEETQRKMFEPFHTTKPKGTGLGLAVTHKILESHQVIVGVESALQVGTEMTLKFPIYKS